MKLRQSAVLMCAVAAVAPSAFAQLPISRVLTMDVAQVIAQEAMSKCRADGYKVTVLVVDGLNAAKAMESYTMITAPIAGRIVEKKINVGEMALPGQPRDDRGLRRQHRPVGYRRPLRLGREHRLAQGPTGVRGVRPRRQWPPGY